ncbi:hypothetical protein CJT77_14950 [Pseudomonas aeruginosa]|nr:hypothetical protein CJT77_14950 [Pseudomonas aeruginosa]PBZ20843.1 hypothetical protein CJT51_17505 [Pseudomonas aeruginosa]
MWRLMEMVGCGTIVAVVREHCFKGGLGGLFGMWMLMHHPERLRFRLAGDRGDDMACPSQSHGQKHHQHHCSLARSTWHLRPDNSDSFLLFDHIP